METALEGLRVLDLSEIGAGPFCSMVLADLGAEVIRVSPPERKTRPAVTGEFLGHDVYYFTLNRNKKSITLDIRRARKVFYDLAEKADVVLDNYRPGVMEKLGVDHDSLKLVNPGIVSCPITGFGPTGPHAHRPAYDLIAAALSGSMWLAGEGETGPLVSPFFIADIAAGMLACHGILAALYARERTGLGQKVDTSVLEAQIALMFVPAAHYFITGQMPGKAGSGHGLPTAAPYGTFRTRDGFVAVGGHRFFEKLCQALGRPDLLGDPRFDTPVKRRENKAQLLSLLQEIFLTRTTAQWLEALEAGDVPCAPVNRMDEGLADPQVLERGMVAQVDYQGTPIKGLGNPIKLSATPPDKRGVYRSPPAIGQHTREVLSQLLGYSESKIEELEKQGAI